MSTILNERRVLPPTYGHPSVRMQLLGGQILILPWSQIQFIPASSRSTNSAESSFIPLGVRPNPA
eukprot:9486146-Pyramimonas_sp.AAC.1